MKTNPDITRLIAKYALILIVLYGFQFILSFVIRDLLNAYEITPQKTILYYLNPFSIFILNLVAAIIVRSDIRKYSMSTNYITVLTLLFKPIGVCLFLISFILQTGNQEELSATDEQTLA